jgi:hypothetical protein
MTTPAATKTRNLINRLKAEYARRLDEAYRSGLKGEDAKDAAYDAICDDNYDAPIICLRRAAGLK